MHQKSSLDVQTSTVRTDHVLMVFSPIPPHPRADGTSFWPHPKKHSENIFRKTNQILTNYRQNKNLFVYFFAANKSYTD